MATVEPPRRNSDGTITYRVRWRENGARPTWSICTRDFGTQAGSIAERFADLVELAGNKMPTADQLTAFGLQSIIRITDDPAPVSAQPAAVVTVAETVRRYLDYLTASANPPSARTLKEYEGYLRRDIACRALGALDVATVEFEHIDAWQKELLTTVGPFGKRVLSPESVRKERQSLLAPAFTFACSIKSGRPPLRALSSPLADSDLPAKGPQYVRDILETPDEYALFARIAYRVDPNWAKMVATVATTGLRYGDAVQLGPDAVIARRHVLRVTERFTDGQVEQGRKNGDEGTVPVPEWVTSRILLPALTRGGSHLFVGPAGNRWSYSTEWDRWDATRKALRAEGLHIHLTHHSLRKGYRTWLSTCKIETPKIDLAMGHRTGGIRERYTALTAADRDEIRTAMTALLPEDVWPGR